MGARVGLPIGSIGVSGGLLILPGPISDASSKIPLTKREDTGNYNL